MARALSASASELATDSSRASAHDGEAGVLTATPTPFVTEVPPATPTAQANVAMLVATPTPAAAEVPAAPASESVQVGSLPAATAQTLTVAAQDAGKAAALLDLMNGARLNQGLDPLVVDADLNAVALARANNLIDNDYFDHYSATGESAFSELAARGIRYRLAGENLARNNYIDGKTVEAAFDALMASDGHRANILESRFSSVGVAAVLNGHLWIYVTVFTN